MTILSRVIAVVAILWRIPALAGGDVSRNDVDARVIDILWLTQIETVRAAAASDHVCGTIELSRLKGAAAALDAISGLHESDAVEWQNVPIDDAGLHSGIIHWQRWFDANRGRLELIDVVNAVEAVMEVRSKDIVP